MTLNDLLQSYDQNKQTDVVILDLSKAFDIVPHNKLMYTLEKYGIKGDLYKWLTSFHTKREMRVVIDGEQSNKGHRGIKSFTGNCHWTLIISMPHQ